MSGPAKPSTPAEQAVAHVFEQRTEGLLESIGEAVALVDVRAAWRAIRSRAHHR